MSTSGYECGKCYFFPHAFGLIHNSFQLIYVVSMFVYKHQSNILKCTYFKEQEIVKKNSKCLQLILPSKYILFKVV